MRQVARSIVCLAFLCFSLIAGALHSAAPVMAAEEKAAAPANAPVIKTETPLQKQVRSVSSKLRCPVCQGESIYDSHSDVAVEMKQLIAEKLSQGESEADVLSYFQARYGNYILMEPPAEGIHWVIWVFPLFMGLMGLLFLMQYLAANKETARAETAERKPAETQNKDSAPVRNIEELHL